MPTLLTPKPTADEATERPSREKAATGGGGSRPRPPKPTGGGGGGGNGDGYRSGQRLKFAVWLGICAILMFFVAVASAMIVRRVGDDWRSLDIPRAFWVSTSLLLFSSAAFEAAKRQLRHGTLARLRRWITAAVVLGTGFLTAQAAGWLELARQGIFVNTTPSGSFFYLLTAAHGAHVAGGLAVLGYVAVRIRRPGPWPARGPVIEASALYWHFMDALWLMLLALLAFLG